MKNPYQTHDPGICCPCLTSNKNPNKNLKLTAYFKKLLLLLIVVYLTDGLLINVNAQCISQGLINYPINGNTTAIITSGAGIASTTAASYNSNNGVATGVGAIFTNATAGGCVQATVGSFGGSASMDFVINGSNIPLYKTFGIYFQTQRTSPALSTNLNLTFSYSKNGGAFQSFTGSTATVTTTYTGVTATLPVGADNPATSLTIRITATNGAFNLASPIWRVDNFQVSAIPGPVAPLTTGSSICTGGSATIAATVTGNPLFNWYPVSSGGASLSTSLSYAPVNGNPTVPVAYSNTTPGNYTFYAQATLLGCNSTRTAAIVSVATPVNVAPAVGPTEVCSGGNATLNANITNGTSPFTISWSPATFLNSTSLAAPSISNATSTTTYTVTVSDACGNTASGTVSLNVNNLPLVDINSVPIIPVICGSGNVSLTASGANSYAWSPAAGLSSTNTAAVTASPSATTTYTVTGTSVSGCTATSTITVAYSPTHGFTSVSTPLSVCNNGSIVLTAGAANTSSYSVSQVPFDFIPQGAYTGVSLANDAMSGVISLPFTFNFYGKNVSQFFICSNGFIQFETSSGSTGVNGQTLPNAANPNNIIAGVWADLDPGAGGTIRHWTSGSAPNRVFVVQFNGVPFDDVVLSSNGNATFQIQLYESSNKVEIHVQTVVNALIPISSVTTLALKNSNGSLYTAPAGRYNNGNWTAGTPEAWRFNPSGGTFTYSWSPATFLNSTTGSSPIAQNVTANTIYTVTAADANGCTKTAIVDISTYQPSIASINPVTASICSGTSIPITASDTASTVFTNGSIIAINDNAAASPYPSNISVSGIPSNATVKSVAIKSISHTFPDDIDVILVSPTGQIVTLMSDMGGGTDISNVSYTFKDGMPALSDASQNISGTYSPTNDAAADNYPAPGPGSINGTSTLSAFTGDPNGTWKLFVVDDASGDLGNIAGGWSIEFSYTGTFSYVWSPATGLNTTTAQVVTASPEANTVYSVLVTNLVTGCNQTVSSSINLLPHANAYLLEGDTTLCSNHPGFNMHVKDSGLFAGGFPAGTIFNFYGAGAILYQTGLDSVFFNANNSDNFYAQVILPSAYSNCSSITDTSIVDFSSSQAPQLLLQSDSVNCYGNSNGKAVASIGFGGTPRFRWQWYSESNVLLKDTTHSLTSDTLDNLPAGKYILVITDHQDSLTNPYCQVLDSVVVGQPSGPLNVTENIFNHINILCNGNATGAIDLVVTGGTIPYTYLWSNGSTLEDISNLAAGTYTCTISDDRNCSTSISIIVAEPPALALNATLTHVLCNGATGSVDVSVSGGTAPYAYNWSNGNTVHLNSGITAGTYTLTVTDANGCVLSGTYVINEPVSLTASCIATNSTCFNSNNGSLSSTVLGGTAPFSYFWSNGAVAPSQNLLAPGVYVLTVTDANGCTSQCNSTITEPALLAVTYNSENVLCTGSYTGSINITSVGGVTPYAYNWSNGATTEDLSGLPAGVYDCIITDANGCTVDVNITINEPLPLSIVPVIAHVQCHGGTGSVSINVSGGIAPYSYIWSNGNNTASIAGITAGTYTVTVTDGNACTLSGNYIIIEPAILNISCASSNSSCFNSNNGIVSATVSGGTIPYSYLWSNGASTDSQNSLAPGTYTLTVTDLNGCSSQCTSVITQPSMLVATVTSLTFPTSASPNNGSINIDVTGGIAPYNYVWSNSETSQNISGLTSGNYSVSVIDANGCTTSLTATLQLICTLGYTNQLIQIPSCGMNNGIASVIPSGGTQFSYEWQTNPIQTTSTATGLSSYYSTIVIITDISGCSTTDTLILPSSMGLALNLASPSYAGGYKIRCNGGNDGSINLTVGGSTGPYTYTWSNGATTQNLTGLTAGTYIVTVSNGGCTNSALITLNQPSALTATTIRTNPSCYGSSNGSATVNAAGGVTPYAYSWNTSPVKTSATVTGLSAGIYTVTISDANGCTKTAMVTLVQPPLISITGVVTNVNCFGGTNGSINITPTGGTPPYTYLWTGGAVTQDRLNVLPAGTYTVTVTDSKGCTMQYTNSVSQPAVLNGVATSTNVSCYGGNNGTANVTASGGTAPYSYSWNTAPPKSTASVTGLKKGSYTVIITDSRGCLKGVNITITEPSAINISISKINVSLPGGNNGSATANVSGGVSPYNYSWNTVPVKTSQTATGLSAGTYIVTVTDANGCTKTASVHITQPGPRMISDAKNVDQPVTLIYPNPSDGKFTISFSETYIKNVDVQIYNITGALVFTSEFKPDKIHASFDVTLKDLPKGLYIIRYRSENKTWIDRIALE